MTRFAAIIISSILLGTVSFADSAHDACINDCNSKFASPSSPNLECISSCPAEAAPASNVPSCNQRLAQLTQACNEASTAATNDCDDSQNTGLAQAQKAAVVLGQQVSSSVQAACSAMGNISQAANAATAAYQMSCQSSVDTCNSSCNAAIQYYTANSGCVVGPFLPGSGAPAPTELKDTLKTCTKLQSKADTAQQAVGNFLATTMQAQNCATEANGTSTTLPEICKTNPNLAGCTATGPVDCTNPAMASNKVCVCSKNPNDPSCNGAQSSGSTSLASSDGTASRMGSSAGDGMSGDNFGLPAIQQAPLNKSAAEAPIDGKQGSGTQFGSSGTGGSGSDGKGGKGGAAEDPVGVNAGFYGGGGGSSGGGGYGGGSGGDGEGRYANSAAALAAAKAGGPNLRQFLPGGQFDPKARGVAGVSGPDGITGPHSNIWQKIQNRYQVVSPSLMP